MIVVVDVMTTIIMVMVNLLCTMMAGRPAGWRVIMLQLLELGVPFEKKCCGGGKAKADQGASYFGWVYDLFGCSK